MRSTPAQANLSMGSPATMAVKCFDLFLFECWGSGRRLAVARMYLRFPMKDTFSALPPRGGARRMGVRTPPPDQTAQISHAKLASRHSRCERSQRILVLTCGAPSIFPLPRTGRCGR